METAFVSEETFTQDAFWRWMQERPASDVNRYELIRGRIVMSPPAGMRHGGIELRLAARLGRHVEERRLGIAFGSSTGFELPSGDTLEPDASFVSAERLAGVPRPLPDGFARVVPNLVVEILSPATARRDRTEKREIYAQSGVEEYWIVDTQAREIAVYALERGELAPRGAYRQGLVPSLVLPDLELSIDEVFADLA